MMNDFNEMRNPEWYNDPTPYKALRNIEEDERAVYRGNVYYTQGLEHNAPCVVVSHNLNNKHSDNVQVVFLTTKERIPMPKYFARVQAAVPSFAKCNQIHTVKKDCIGNYIRVCSQDEISAIEEAILYGLGIERDAAPVVSQVLTQEESCVSNAEVTKLEAEKNLYKMLYEQLQEKLLNRLTGA